jgi:hypothetical protein
MSQEAKRGEGQVEAGSLAAKAQAVVDQNEQAANITKEDAAKYDFY